VGVDAHGNERFRCNMTSRSEGLFFESEPPGFFFTGSWSDSFSVMNHDNVPFQIDNEKRGEAEEWRVHDLNATLLHQFGLDHERLTHRFQGRDYRLTDVRGEVVKGILA